MTLRVARWFITLSLGMASLAIGQTTAPSVALDDNPWGVAPSAQTTGTAEQWLPVMKSAGVGWARMFGYWGGFQKTQDTWSWEGGDKLLAQAKQHNVKLLAPLIYAPKWATLAGAKGHPFPVNHLDDWQGYVGKVVDRYKDDVKHWEVWNEPNGGFKGTYGKGKWDTTTDYTNLVLRAYEAAKKSDPTAQVGLTVASFDLPYIHQVILTQAKLGKPDSFDFICVHPYETVGGLRKPDGEVPYLWMTRLMRDMLKESAPKKADVEIWITEVAQRISDKVTDQEAAAALVKIYAMSLAQGIAKTFWFEPRDAANEDPGFGLLDKAGEPRVSFKAITRLIAALGEKPKYLGWLALGDGGRGYGFVFEGPSGPVLVAWNPVDLLSSNVTFAGDVQATHSLTGERLTIKANEPFALTPQPVLVSGLPAAVVAQATANAPQKFPWGGDFSKVKQVGLSLEKPDAATGVRLVASPKDSAHTFDDGSRGEKVNHQQYLVFGVHPSFASIHQREYYIRVKARRPEPKGKTALLLSYEVADSKGMTAYPRKGEKMVFADGDGEWQTFTWHLTDACFAKMWNYDFNLMAEGPTSIVVGDVQVSTQPFE